MPVLTVKADVLTLCLHTYHPSIGYAATCQRQVCTLLLSCRRSPITQPLGPITTRLQPLQGNTNALDTLLISPPTYGGAVVPVAPWKLRTSSHGRGNLTGSLRESWEGHRHIANKLTPVAKVQWSSCDPSLLAARWGVVVCSQRAGY